MLVEGRSPDSLNHSLANRLNGILTYPPQIKANTNADAGSSDVRHEEENKRRATIRGQEQKDWQLASLTGGPIIEDMKLTAQAD